jgi:hypothetical protein
MRGKRYTATLPRSWDNPTVGDDGIVKAFVRRSKRCAESWRALDEAQEPRLIRTTDLSEAVAEKGRCMCPGHGIIAEVQVVGQS